MFFGGGFKKGFVYGKTADEHPMVAVENPVPLTDVHATIYKALGIDFPSAVVLHGPPGCGKTFAVDRLVDFLGWPSFQIDASSVASPYIHGGGARA